MTAEEVRFAHVVELARSGDAAAFNDLVTCLHTRVYRWALAMTGDSDDADDVTQDAFVAMHRGLAAFRGDAPVTTWAYRITARAASQRRRTSERRSRIARVVPPERHVYETDPGARVDRERLTAIVRTAWANLPDRQREVFDLVDLQGMSAAAVADLLGMKAVTVRANLFKARHTIRADVLASLDPRDPGVERGRKDEHGL